MNYRVSHLSYRVYISVASGSGKGCSSQSNLSVSSIEDRVESFEETLAIDEVESRSTIAANVTNNHVNPTGSTTRGRVKATRPYLCIGSQFERDLVKKRRDIQ